MSFKLNIFAILDYQQKLCKTHKKIEKSNIMMYDLHEAKIRQFLRIRCTEDIYIKKNIGWEKYLISLKQKYRCTVKLEIDKNDFTKDGNVNQKKVERKLTHARAIFN